MIFDRSIPLILIPCDLPRFVSEKIKNKQLIFALSEPYPRAEQFELRSFVPVPPQIATVDPDIPFFVLFHIDKSVSHCL